MVDPYEENIVATYHYWTVYVHQDQGFIGRCVVWCTRADALELTDATEKEREELFVILRTLKTAVQNAFGATWFNYSFLGNVDRHLHCHFIPRYQQPVEFGGVVFEDLNYNAATWKTGTTNKVSRELLSAIRDRLKEVI